MSPFEKSYVSITSSFTSLATQLYEMRETLEDVSPTVVCIGDATDLVTEAHAKVLESQQSFNEAMRLIKTARPDTFTST